MSWIPVKDKLPENDNVMIVTIHDPIGEYSSTAYYSKRRQKWINQYGEPVEVTAWMQFPEAFREDGEET